MNPIKNLQNSNLQRLNQADGAGPVKNQKETRDEKMLEAAKGFENQFVRQMITEMRKTVPKSELVDETMADDIYRDQLDNQYANMWVNNGGIGLADMIYQQLQDRYGNNPQPLPKNHGEFLKLNSHGAAGPNGRHHPGPPVRRRARRR